jgi:hypothetical protein
MKEYSQLQTLRHARGKATGASKTLARRLRMVAAMLDRKKERREFTREEIRMLQTLRKLITVRLEFNAIAKIVSRLPPDATNQTPIDDPDPRDI